MLIEKFLPKLIEFAKLFEFANYENHSYLFEPPMATWGISVKNK